MEKMFKNSESSTKLLDISKENFIAEDGRVYILGPFDRSISSEVIPAFLHLIDVKKEEKDPTIEIFINSCGGYACELFGLLSVLDMAKAEGIKIVTYNIGIAYSCGSLLAVYGDVRRMHRFADNVAHLGEAGMLVSTKEQIEREVDYLRKHFNTILTIYEEHTNVPRNKLEELLSDDQLHIDAKQCLKLGFCDEIF